MIEQKIFDETGINVKLGAEMSIAGKIHKENRDNVINKIMVKNIRNLVLHKWL